MVSRDYFNKKRIAVIGLGRDFELVEDVKFLIKYGAIVSVYDMKSEARLKSSLVLLRAFGLANYVCGSIPVDDLLDMDLIILSHEYGRDSGFLQPVINSDKVISIEYPETLFFKLSPPVTIVGVIGAVGKSSLISMLRPLLENACFNSENQKLYVIDSQSQDGTIAHLKKVKNGDIVLVRMDEIVMKEMVKLNISPHVAVFSSLPLEESYDKSPFEVLSHQTYNNFVVALDNVIDLTHSTKTQPRAKMLRTKLSIIPDFLVNDIKFRNHEKESLVIAFQAASLFRLDPDKIWSVLGRWKPLRGRLEFIKKVKGVDYYNDSASVTPESTRYALRTLATEKNIILIMGGSKANGCYGPLYEDIPHYVKMLILLPGSGTVLERKSIEKIPGLVSKSAPTLDEAVRLAMEYSKKGDIVLFSPAFETLIYGSRKERGERFVRAVRNL